MNILITLLLLCQPQAVIEAPDSVLPGDLVILDATASKGSAFEWFLLNKSKSILAFEDNRKCVFASGEAGDYRFLLLAIDYDINSKQIQVSKAFKTIIVTSVPIPPTPVPGPIEVFYIYNPNDISAQTNFIKTSVVVRSSLKALNTSWDILPSNDPLLVSKGYSKYLTNLPIVLFIDRSKGIIDKLINPTPEQIIGKINSIRGQ